jgi:hypothetical protein
MDELDFSTDTQTETEASVGNDIAKAVAGQEKKADDSKEEISSDEAGIEKSTSSEESEGDAVIMYEDDNYIFTSEGIVEKTSLNKQDNSSDAEPKKEDEKILGKFDDYDQLVKSYKELETKLGENSEAVNKLRELNPVLPMLEAMLGDETFLEMAESYFTDPQAQSEAMKKQLGIDDNFVFDLNQALSDPKSEDAKILNKLMQAKQPKQTQNQPKQTQQISDRDKKELMDKYGLSEAEYDQMMDKAATHKITHDDIYFLMNKEKIIAEAKKEAQSGVKKQMQTAQRLKKPVSAGEATNQQPSPEDSFMNALSTGKGLFDD